MKEDGLKLGQTLLTSEHSKKTVWMRVRQGRSDVVDVSQAGTLLGRGFGAPVASLEAGRICKAP